MTSHSPSLCRRRLCVALFGLTGFASSLLLAQPAPPAAAGATPEPASVQLDPFTPSAESASADEVIVLSPFEVTETTKGYYSANTMSGTRLNTKLEDLAASISVVNLEQMADFGMLDINDVFLYTANTEGTGTYTDITVDRNGQVTDNSQGNPNNANRVRGIASANVAYGNFEVTGRTPLDPLIVGGVEVSRGPNANVFGLGNPSGTVNQVPATANLTRNTLSTQVRADSYGGWRTSFDVNQVLVKNKLALRVNGLKQHDDWQREPTGFDTRRLNAMIKFRPFKYTTLTASYLYYYGAGNRPNNTTPRDYVSAWTEAGSPGWDPVTQLITVNGTTYGADVAGAAATHLVPNSTIPLPNTSAFYLQPRVAAESDALYAARRAFSFAGGAFQRSNIFVDQAGITYWTAPTSTTGTTPGVDNGGIRLAGPSASTMFGASVAGRFDEQPLFTTTPTVASKELYDWENINLSAIDQFADRTDTYYIQLEQIFLNTPRQNLAAVVAMFREDAERYRRTPASNSGTSGQTGQLWVDVNLRNLDGTANPNFGRPFIGVIEPRTSLAPALWDTYRAQVAYQIDLSREQNWLKWLGSHQISAYGDYKYRINRQYSYRDVMVSDTAWINGALTPAMARGNQGSATNGPQAGPNIMRGFFRYYVGDNEGSNVDYAPTAFNYGSYPFVWGNTGNWHYDPITIGQVATTDGTGGTANTKQILKTPGAVIQSNFLNGAIVTTFGTRVDKVYSKNGQTPPPPPAVGNPPPHQLLAGEAADRAGVANNTAFNYDVIDHWEANWRYSSGRTTTSGIVVRPFRDRAFVDRWANSESGAKSLLGEVLRGFALTYNQSDNFIPQAPAVDLYLNQLPNSTGDGKDFGFWLNILDGKLVLRVNRYENNQFNARNGDANTIAQRILRRELDAGQSDTFRLYAVASAWLTSANPNWEPDRLRQEVFNTMQIEESRYNALVENYQNGTIAATNDITGKGTEIEINYNPTNYWTLAANANETRSINSNVSSAIQNYIDERWELWTTLVDTSLTPTAANPDRLWWKNNYGGSQTAEQNFASFVDAPWSVIRETQGKSQPAVARYAFRVSTNLQLRGITEQSILKKLSVGGAVRWEDKKSIGYYGVQQLPDRITQLDPDKPIWEPAQFYFDAFLTYKTKLYKKVNATFRFNVRNIQESGGLRAIRAFPDGTPYAYRIVEPRQFIFTASFDL